MIIRLNLTIKGRITLNSVEKGVTIDNCVMFYDQRSQNDFELVMNNFDKILKRFKLDSKDFLLLFNVKERIIENIIKEG